MVYAFDARPASCGGSARRTRACRRRPPPQEHLRLGDAVHRRRAALRLVRPERRAVLLLARRQAAVEEALAAAADLPRLRHRVVADGRTTAASTCSRTAKPSRPSSALDADGQGALAHAARRTTDSRSRPGRRRSCGRTRPDRDRDDGPRVVISLRPRRARNCGGSGGMSMPTASPRSWNGWLYAGTGSQGDANRPFLAIKPGARATSPCARHDEQRLRRLAPPAGIGIHAVGARPRRPRLSRPRHRHPGRARCRRPARRCTRRASAAAATRSRPRRWRRVDDAALE